MILYGRGSSPGKKVCFHEKGSFLCRRHISKDEGFFYRGGVFLQWRLILWQRLRTILQRGLISAKRSNQKQSAYYLYEKRGTNAWRRWVFMYRQRCFKMWSSGASGPLLPHQTRIRANQVLNSSVVKGKIQLWLNRGEIVLGAQIVERRQKIDKENKTRGHYVGKRGGKVPSI